MYFAHLVIKSLISRTNVQGSNIWIFIHSLNDSNLKLIFICLQFQISILNDQKSQSSPRFSGHIVFLCPVWFSPYWLKGNLKSDRLTMKSFTSFPEIHLRFMTAHLEIPWYRNDGQEIKLYFPLSYFRGVQFLFIHTVFPHTVCSSVQRLSIWIDLWARVPLMPCIPCWHFVPASESHSYRIWMAHNMYSVRFSSVKWKVILWLQYSYFDYL